MAQTRSSSNLVWNILSYGVLILLAVLSVGPLLWMLLTSFKVEDDIVTRTMVYFPTRFTFEWYTKLWNQSGYPVGSSRVDLQACKLEYSIVSPK